MNQTIAIPIKNIDNKIHIQCQKFKEELLKYLKNNLQGLKYKISEEIIPMPISDIFYLPSLHINIFINQKCAVSFIIYCQQINQKQTIFYRCESFFYTAGPRKVRELEIPSNPEASFITPEMQVDLNYITAKLKYYYFRSKIY